MLIIKLEGDACFLPSDCLLSWSVESDFSWGREVPFVVAGAGSALAKHLQRALTRVPMLVEKNPPGKMREGMDTFCPFKERLKDKLDQINPNNIAAATLNSFLSSSLSVRGALRVVPHGQSKVLPPCQLSC